MSSKLEKELEGIFLTILDPDTRERGFRRLEAKFGGDEAEAQAEAPARGDNVIAFPAGRAKPQVVEAKVVTSSKKPPKKQRRKSGKGVLKFVEENADAIRTLAVLVGEVVERAFAVYTRTKAAPRPRTRRPKLPAPKS